MLSQVFILINTLLFCINIQVHYTTATKQSDEETENFLKENDSVSNSTVLSSRKIMNKREFSTADSNSTSQPSEAYMTSSFRRHAVDDFSKFSESSESVSFLSRDETVYSDNTFKYNRKKKNPVVGRKLKKPSFSSFDSIYEANTTERIPHKLKYEKISKNVFPEDIEIIDIRNTQPDIRSNRNTDQEIETNDKFRPLVDIKNDSVESKSGSEIVSDKSGTSRRHKYESYDSYPAESENLPNGTFRRYKSERYDSHPEESENPLIGTSRRHKSERYDSHPEKSENLPNGTFRRHKSERYDSHREESENLLIGTSRRHKSERYDSHPEESENPLIGTSRRHESERYDSHPEESENLPNGTFRRHKSERYDSHSEESENPLIGTSRRHKSERYGSHPEESENLLMKDDTAPDTSHKKSLRPPRYQSKTPDHCRKMKSRNIVRSTPDESPHRSKYQFQRLENYSEREDEYQVENRENLSHPKYHSKVSESHSESRDENFRQDISPFRSKHHSTVSKSNSESESQNSPLHLSMKSPHHSGYRLRVLEQHLKSESRNDPTNTPEMSPRHPKYRPRVPQLNPESEKIEIPSETPDDKLRHSKYQTRISERSSESKTENSPTDIPEKSLRHPRYLSKISQKTSKFESSNDSTDASEKSQRPSKSSLKTLERYPEPEEENLTLNDTEKISNPSRYHSNDQSTKEHRTHGEEPNGQPNIISRSHQHRTKNCLQVSNEFESNDQSTLKDNSSKSWKKSVERSPQNDKSKKCDSDERTKISNQLASKQLLATEIDKSLTSFNEKVNLKLKRREKHQNSDLITKNSSFDSSQKGKVTNSKQANTSYETDESVTNYSGKVMSNSKPEADLGSWRLENKSSVKHSELEIRDKITSDRQKRRIIPYSANIGDGRNNDNAVNFSSGPKEYKSHSSRINGFSNQKIKSEEKRNGKHQHTSTFDESILKSSQKDSRPYSKYSLEKKRRNQFTLDPIIPEYFDDMKNQKNFKKYSASESSDISDRILTGRSRDSGEYTTDPNLRKYYSRAGVDDNDFAKFVIKLEKEITVTSPDRIKEKSKAIQNHLNRHFRMMGAKERDFCRVNLGENENESILTSFDFLKHSSKWSDSSRSTAINMEKHNNIWIKPEEVEDIYKIFRSSLVQYLQIIITFIRKRDLKKWNRAARPLFCQFISEAEFFKANNLVYPDPKIGPKMRQINMFYLHHYELQVKTVLLSETKSGTLSEVVLSCPYVKVREHSQKLLSDDEKPFAFYVSGGMSKRSVFVFMKHSKPNLASFLKVVAHVVFDEEQWEYLSEYRNK